MRNLKTNYRKFKVCFSTTDGKYYRKRITARNVAEALWKANDIYGRIYNIDEISSVIACPGKTDYETRCL